MKIYSKARVSMAMIALVAILMLDHMNSPTFAYNMGLGGDTALLKLDTVSGSGCGAP